MKRYLVGVALDYSGHTVASVNVDMPDDYNPINDDSDKPNPYPVLRKAVYEAKRKHRVTGEYFSSFKPDKITVIAISFIGHVESMRVGSKELCTNDVNPYLIAKYGIDCADKYVKLIDSLGTDIADYCYVVPGDTHYENNVYVITLMVRDKYIYDIAVNSVERNSDLYHENNMRVMCKFGDVFNEYIKLYYKNAERRT